jgi:hypothetical protein
MLVSYTRLENVEDFKLALGDDVDTAAKINSKLAKLLKEMSQGLASNFYPVGGIAELNKAAIIEAEKTLNILLMLRSNLEHFEEEKKQPEEKQLLQEKDEVTQAQERLGNLVEQIQNLGKNKSED